ncbi:MAG TPA: alpha-amylase, partial [bacterium]|nr:alpha-amylase [bacterium]
MRLRTVLSLILLLSFCCCLTFCGKQTFDTSVPEWAKKVVWYQIFPERFRNGDPGNDPTTADIRGSWP